MTKARRKTVLIIEDNDIHMHLTKDILHPRGYTTLETASGAEGLILAKQHRPDLIVLDIQLRDISGIEVIQQLKENEDLKDIPVMVVTAFAMPGDKEHFLSLGCDAYISKPIIVANFLKMVESFLNEEA